MHGHSTLIFTGSSVCFQAFGPGATALPSLLVMGRFALRKASSGRPVDGPHQGERFSFSISMTQQNRQDDGEISGNPRRMVSMSLE